MELTPAVFQIDCPAEARKIEAFIREKMTELHREGIVVPLSGGLDSSTVVTSCTRAVGKEKVTGLLLPEKNGNPDALAFAKQLASQLSIQAVTIDISRILKELGTYRFIADQVGSRTIVKRFVEGIPTVTRKEYFIGGITGTSNPLVRQGLASMLSKHRVRMVVTYKFAEERGLMVVGSAHLSEDLVGLYSKYGVDDAADVMPLKHLYRAQILQLARFLGIPHEIVERKPNPDMLPGIEDKYFDVLGIPSETLDLILYGLQHGLPPEEIATQLQLGPARVLEIQELVHMTEHMRHHAYSP